MILLTGPPGAGKSLQAQQVEDQCGYKWISMGVLLRESLDATHMQELKQGKMIEDSLTFSILKKAIIAVPKDQPIILDGFPRRDSQVKWFLEFIESDHRDLRSIVHLKVSEEVSLERLSQRGRQDDKAEVISNRYHLYQSEILPMIQHLGNMGVTVYEIDGEQSKDAVAQEIKERIECKLR